MAGTEITTAEINTHMNAAVAALGSDDFTEAYKRALQAQGLMLAKPRSSFDRDELEWSPDKIEAFLNRISGLKKSSTSSGSITMIPVRRTCGNLSDYE